MDFWASMDNTVYLHGPFSLLDPRDRRKEPGCKIMDDPIYFPACPECCMVLSLFWSSFNVLQLLDHHHALGSAALCDRPDIPVLNSGFSDTRPVFLLDIFCSGPQLRDPYHESGVFWDFNIKKKNHLSLFCLKTSRYRNY